MQKISMLTYLAALALFGSVPASAGTLAVSPLRITFSGATGISSVTVENNGREEALVQTETFAWRQVSGEHKLSTTDDVVAVPPVFRLAPGAQQQVRVGLTRAFTEKNEQTFRLTITEVPTATVPGTVAVAVRHSLPIFVRPSSALSSNLGVKRHASNGLEIANSGSEHVRIHRWRLRDSAGAILAEDAGPGYLLSGASQVLAVTDNRIGRAALFEAESDARTLKIAVGE